MHSVLRFFVVRCLLSGLLAVQVERYLCAALPPKPPIDVASYLPEERAQMCRDRYYEQLWEYAAANVNAPVPKKPILRFVKKRKNSSDFLNVALVNLNPVKPEKIKQQWLLQDEIEATAKKQQLRRNCSAIENQQYQCYAYPESGSSSVEDDVPLDTNSERPNKEPVATASIIALRLATVAS
jgi:hypothetical protein